MTERTTSRTVLGVDWRAALLSGIVAGLAFIVVLIAFAPLIGLSAWQPIQMIAAIALGPTLAAQPMAFSWAVLFWAIVIHLTLSLLYAFVIASWVRRRARSSASVRGLLIGTIIYVLNFHIFVGAYPWFFELQNLSTLLAHWVFGLVAAMLYVSIEQAVWPLWRENTP